MLYPSRISPSGPPYLLSPPPALIGAAPDEAQSRTLHRLEIASTLHVVLLVTATTWAFGGQASWVRLPLTLLASAGGVITVVGLTREAFWQTSGSKLWRCFVPFLGLCALVLAGGCNPSLVEVQGAGGSRLALSPSPVWLPSSARPVLGREALWYFAAVWVSALNLLLFVRRGRLLRALLLVLAVNALVLAVLGTLQKLSGSGGVYFGTIAVPQPRFFSTFIYHNHWGAFVVMMLALTLGLGWHYVRTVPSRDIYQGPLALVVFAVVTLTITLPLSGSRSCTLAGTALLAGASIHVAVHAVRRRRQRNLKTLPPLLALGLLWIGIFGAAWFTGRGTILDRLETSRSQITAMREMGSIGDRALLYHNTWRMARDKPLFGWGMSSYPHIFYGFYNTRTSPDGLPVFYNDAHNDWLQALAEHGFVGTGLLAACAAVPFWLCRRSVRSSLITVYVLSGLGAVLAYAIIEFPFGNRANVLVWWCLFFAALAYARSREGLPSGPTANTPGN
jgi:O-antigen ligase